MEIRAIKGEGDAANNRLEIKFDRDFEDRICKIIDIAHDVNYEQLFKIMELNILATPYWHEAITYEENRQICKDTIKYHAYTVDMIVTTHNDCIVIRDDNEYEITVLCNRYKLTQELYDGIEYNNLTMEDSDGYGIILHLGYDSSIQRYMKSKYRRNSIKDIINELEDELEPTNFGLYNPGRYISYSMYTAYMVKYDLNKLSEIESKNEYLLGRDSNKSFNINDLYRQLMILGCDKGKHFMLSELDSKLEPFGFIGYKDKNLIITV